MTALTLAVRDSATMTRRSLRHVLRYPVTLVVAVAVPVLVLLLFVGVFGALKASLGAHASYIDYVSPSSPSTGTPPRASSPGSAPWRSHPPRC